MQEPTGDGRPWSRDDLYDGLLTAKARRETVASQEAVLGWMDRYPVLESTSSALAGAIDLGVEHQLGSWDSLVLSVAADAGTRLLISEDFNPGCTWRGVRVVNPFADPLDPVLVQLIETAQQR